MSVIDRYAALTCGHCGEAIDEALELAGKIEFRLDGEVALHPNSCAAEYDAEAPTAMRQDRKAAWVGGYAF